MKTLITSFWERTIVNGVSFVSGRNVGAFNSAVLYTRVFYLLIFFASCQSYSTHFQVADWGSLMKGESYFTPLWTMKWAILMPWNLLVNGVLVTFTAGALCGLLWGYRSRGVRIFTAFTFLIYVSLVSGFGKIDHYFHLALVVSFIFILLPDRTDTEEGKTGYLSVYFGAQVFALCTYTSSGMFKLLGIAQQYWLGEVTAFAPDALARHAAKTMSYHPNDYFLSELVLNYPSYLWSVFLVAGYMVEFFSVWVAFRPALHRVWGVMLMMLHVLILMTVGPDFIYQVLVVGVLITLSPFCPYGKWLYQLPWIGVWLAARQAGKAHTLVQIYLPANVAEEQRIPEIKARVGAGNARWLDATTFRDQFAEFPDLIRSDAAFVAMDFNGGNTVIFQKSDALIFLKFYFGHGIPAAITAALIPSLVGQMLYDLAFAKNSNQV